MQLANVGQTGRICAGRNQMDARVPAPAFGPYTTVARIGLICVNPVGRFWDARTGAGSLPTPLTWVSADVRDIAQGDMGLPDIR